jgi:hypothetical protein
MLFASTAIGRVYCGEELELTLTACAQEPLYKVKWEGWEDEGDKTWEPEDNLWVPSAPSGNMNGH